MNSSIYPAAIALWIAGCVGQSALAASSPIACKLIDNIDPSRSRFQFEITNVCLSPACITQHLATATIPAGGKIVVNTYVKTLNRHTGTYTFTLDKALAPKESVRFDRKPQGSSCKAVASW